METKTDVKPEIPASLRDGDVIAHCAHVENSPSSLYWCENSRYESPDGTRRGRVHWFYCCKQCEQTLLADPANLRVESDLHRFDAATGKLRRVQEPGA